MSTTTPSTGNVHSTKTNAWKKTRKEKENGKEREEANRKGARVRVKRATAKRAKYVPPRGASNCGVMPQQREVVGVAERNRASGCD